MSSKGGRKYDKILRNLEYYIVLPLLIKNVADYYYLITTQNTKDTNL